MATDALISLAAQATVTATTNGTPVVLAGGTPRRGLVARIIYSAASASAADTITFSIDVCYDGVPTTWYSDFVAPPITLPLSSAPASGEIFIPFSISPTSVANGTQIRLTATFSSTAHTDTIKYGGELQLARP
jgi:hypothetical protein